VVYRNTFKASGNKLGYCKEESLNHVGKMEGIKYQISS